jgi:hypothetical protein
MMPSDQQLSKKLQTEEERQFISYTPVVVLTICEKLLRYCKGLRSKCPSVQMRTFTGKGAGVSTMQANTCNN